MSKSKKPTQPQEQSQEEHTHSTGMDMGNRGVTRPMSGGHGQHGVSQEHEDHGASHHHMTPEQRMHMLHQHHRQTLWLYWLLVLLGIWLVLSPLTFDYGKSVVMPSGGRDVWLTLQQRIDFSKWSDIISGLLLIIFGWRSLTHNRPVSMWVCCFIGIWITMAPLIFWAPQAVIYLNDTLVGALAIAITILIPGMPNMISHMKMGSEVPSGWSYNPSSWPQRWIMIAAGFAGWMVSRYLGAFQLGYIDHAWDPFFGDSSRQVLNSAMSHSWPVSDAAFGALAYTFEFLMGWMGSPSRWRTMPWMVTLFGILVIPLGLVHIFLVISQPIVVGAWCTMCLLAAGIMLPMIPLEADEVIAMGQHMVQAKRRGEPMWKVFWKGGTPVEQNRDERSPELSQLPQKPVSVLKASVWGMSAPPTLVLSAILGIWLMFSPAAFGIPVQAIAANINHLCGSLAVVVAVISMGEVIRVARLGNIVVGLSVIVFPWLLAAGNTGLNISSTITGLLLIALSVPRGRITEKYGLWKRFVW